MLKIILEPFRNSLNCFVMSKLTAFARSSLISHQVGYFKTNLHVPNQRSCFKVSGNRHFDFLAENGIV